MASISASGRASSLACSDRTAQARRQPSVSARPALCRPPAGCVLPGLTLSKRLPWHAVRSASCRSSTRSTARAPSSKTSTFTAATSGYPAQLSGGLAQRVQIARAIAHRPKVLFLDEPSAGLDPQSRIAMWEAVRGLREEGITVVLTTHYMEEADELCDRVAIIDHGKILVEDTPTALKHSVGAPRVYELDLRNLQNIPVLVGELQKRSGVASVETTSKGVRILAEGTEGLLSEVVNAANPYGLRDLTITETSLETVFIRLTGRDLRE